MQNPEPNLESYRYWARIQFARYKSCVAYIESTDDKGNMAIGTCFHVGEGVFVTARHVVENRKYLQIGFDDDSMTMDFALRPEYWNKEAPGRIAITAGPHFHPAPNVDVACFRVDFFPEEALSLGGHLNDWLGQYELVLNRTLLLGYPPVPLSNRPVLVASLGEVNALVDLYVSNHPQFLISAMARGGFSRGPC